MRRASQVGWGDVLVGVLLVGLLGSAGMAAMHQARQLALQQRCASNLHQIGLAILLYQQDNQQLYPRTTLGEADPPRPTWGTPYAAHTALGPVANADPFAADKTAPAVNDVTAALFLLLRNEQIAPGAFVCPASKAVRWDCGGGPHTAQDWTNWDGDDGLALHLSYSYQNPYASTAAVEAGYDLKNPDATFAVAADMNPGGAAVTTVTDASPADELAKANSLNHDSAGQNVLYGDGHAAWVTSPFAGTRGDNIYTAAGPELAGPGRGTAVVRGSSASGTDSVLLPTATDVGYGPPMDDEDHAKAVAAVRGTYAATIDGKRATLTVGDKAIACATGPVTIRFDYTVTGDNGLGLKLDLTAPETTETATLTLRGDDLTFAGGGKYALGYPWHRVAPK